MALPLQVHLNGRRVGQCDAGSGMARHFGQCVADLAMTRSLRAGHLVCAGVVADADTSHGCASLADKRAQEAAAHGAPRTPWLAWGDRVRLEIKGADGQSLFGLIDQQVTGPGLVDPDEDEDPGDPIAPNTDAGPADDTP